jgi:hypothetical protein
MLFLFNLYNTKDVRLVHQRKNGSIKSNDNSLKIAKGSTKEKSSFSFFGVLDVMCMNMNDELDASSQ